MSQLSVFIFPSPGPPGPESGPRNLAPHAEESLTRSSPHQQPPVTRMQVQVFPPATAGPLRQPPLPSQAGQAPGSNLSLRRYSFHILIIIIINNYHLLSSNCKLLSTHQLIPSSQET